MRVLGRDAWPGPDAPLAPGASIPDGSYEIDYSDKVSSQVLYTLRLAPRVPLDIPFYRGCPFKATYYFNHKGIDLYKTPDDAEVPPSCPFAGTGEAGASVYPAFDGSAFHDQAGKAEVIYAGNLAGTLGNVVILEHMSKKHTIWLRTMYMHLNSLSVSTGDWVTQDDEIGTVGSTGGYLATNAHLHFEVNLLRATHSDYWLPGEIALMPATVIAGRPAVDPEELLEALPGSVLWRVADTPPPAQDRPGPPPDYVGLFDPIWLTYQSPFELEDEIQRVDTFDDDSNERWYLDGDGNTPYNILPIADGCDGLAQVVRVYQNDVTLVHLDQRFRVMVVSEYENLDSVAVSVGDFVGPNDNIGTKTGVCHVSLFRKRASSGRGWSSGEAFTWPDQQGVGGQTNAKQYMADPSCCLTQPSTWVPSGGSPSWGYHRNCSAEDAWS